MVQANAENVWWVMLMACHPCDLHANREEGRGVPFSVSLPQMSIIHRLGWERNSRARNTTLVSGTQVLESSSIPKYVNRKSDWSKSNRDSSWQFYGILASQTLVNSVLQYWPFTVYLIAFNTHTERIILRHQSTIIQEYYILKHLFLSLVTTTLGQKFRWILQWQTACPTKYFP